jgi:hypothetical protein
VAIGPCGGPVAISSHTRPTRTRSPFLSTRGESGDRSTLPRSVPFLLFSSTRRYSAPRARIDAWRTLTLGSGSLTSQPSLRPMTMRGASNVRRRAGEALVFAESTVTVSAIS